MKRRFKTAVGWLGLLGLCGGIAQADTISLASWISIGTTTIDTSDSLGNLTFLAQLAYPVSGMAYDSYGDLYVSLARNYGNDVEKISPQGTVTQLSIPGLDSPGSLTFDQAGNLYIANTAADNILKVSPQGVTTVFATVPGTNTSMGLACDSQGTLYGGFGGISEVVKFDTKGNMSEVTAMPSSYSLAFAPNGTLYVASTAGIYKLNPTGGATLFASGWAVGGVACDSSGDVFADFEFNNEVVKYDPQGNSSVFVQGITNLNAIAIETIPEPSAWALILTGLGLSLSVRPVKRCKATQKCSHSL